MTIPERAMKDAADLIRWSNFWLALAGVDIVARLFLGELDYTPALILIAISAMHRIGAKIIAFIGIKAATPAPDARKRA